MFELLESIHYCHCAKTKPKKMHILYTYMTGATKNVTPEPPRPEVRRQ